MNIEIANISKAIECKVTRSIYRFTHKRSTKCSFLATTFVKNNYDLGSLIMNRHHGNSNFVRLKHVDLIHVGITWPEWVVVWTRSAMDASTLTSQIFCQVNVAWASCLDKLIHCEWKGVLLKKPPPPPPPSHTHTHNYKLNYVNKKMKNCELWCDSWNVDEFTWKSWSSIPTCVVWALLPLDKLIHCGWKSFYKDKPPQRLRVNALPLGYQWTNSCFVMPILSNNFQEPNLNTRI